MITPVNPATRVPSRSKNAPILSPPGSPDLGDRAGNRMRGLALVALSGRLRGTSLEDFRSAIADLLGVGCE